MRFFRKPYLLAVSLTAADLLLAADASADPFHYTDRSGRVVRVDPTPLPMLRDRGGAAPAPAVAAVAPPPEAAPEAAPAPAPPPAPPPTPTLPVFAQAAEPDLLLPVTAMPRRESPSKAPFFSLIQEAAAFYSLPVELVLAVVKIESNFNPQATSKKGALGLMQLMPATASDLGVTDAFDPRQNIFGGVRYLRALVNEFEGQVALAVAAYNAGAGAVRRAGGIPLIPETQAYVPAVLAAYRGYQPAPAGRDRRGETSW